MELLKLKIAGLQAQAAMGENVFKAFQMGLSHSSAAARPYTSPATAAAATPPLFQPGQGSTSLFHIEGVE